MTPHDVRDVFENDLKVKRCRICGHEQPEDMLNRGICEQCLDEMDELDLGVQKSPKKRGFDDDR